MMVEFSVHPMDSAHSSDDIAELVNILAESGVTYEVGAMSTCLEGPWDDIMAVLRQCHTHLMQKHARVVMSIKIDDKKQGEYSLRDRVRIVKDKLDPDTNVSSF